MSLFRKKADPISKRARALNAEIESLQQRIRKYEAQLDQGDSPFRVDGIGTATVDSSRLRSAASRPEASREPQFEAVDQRRLTSVPEPSDPETHYNELGVRKYDLPALFGRVRNHLRGPTTSNPKLVTYLAAGGVQGLRPLRYEKRVARNRFIALALFLFLLLLGILIVFVPHS